MNKTESSIKKILTEFLLEEAKDSVIKPTFIHEMNVGWFSSRADVIVVDDSLTAFEIKSASDTLDRLPKQLSIYEKHFERVVVLCAPKHLLGVQELTGENTAIWIINDAGSILKAKEGRLQAICDDKWLSFLPVREIKKLLSKKHLSPAGDRKAVISSAKESLSLKEIRHYVLYYLSIRHFYLAELKQKQEAAKKAYAEHQESLLKEQEQFLMLAERLSTGVKAIPRAKN